MFVYKRIFELIELKGFPTLNVNIYNLTGQTRFLQNATYYLPVIIPNVRYT